MARLTVLSLWKSKNWSLLQERFWNKPVKTKECTIHSLDEYRATFTPNKLWVNHYLWWSGMLYEARQKRVAKHITRRNRTVNPGRR